MSVNPGASVPDQSGHFGPYGGRFIPETLSAALDQLTAEYGAAQADPAFWGEFEGLLRDFVGRPTSIYRATHLEALWGGPRVYLKREDLAHTGAHKINNSLGQALLTRRMGKQRVIAETGAGQHGVATATACALLGLECRIYMGSEDCRRQALNVQRMRLLGAEVVPVESGSRTLKDAINEAMRDWVTNVESTHYILGSVLGPHPFPQLVRDFQSIIGREARAQLVEREGRLPTALVACVGGGSNSIGLFHAFLGDDSVRMLAVEAGGEGIASGRHAARFQEARVGVLHGTRTYLLADDHGQIRETHSVSAGLDYPAVGPEHAQLHDSGRVEYVYATDQEAITAFQELAAAEGILPALESSHALAHARKLAACLSADDLILVNLSGRGDKDVQVVIDWLAQPQG
ncbi:MAG: tryptophan synthase subunit beta [Candidatus Eisenbacteria bacterium]|nr:tryptophan synthase subunit beta [Candidatus Eisenbacteria bacterium]MCC7141804.1 tryptophan synthase subunit beta [Candidatus Eisenbacteria bacterium]